MLELDRKELLASLSPLQTLLKKQSDQDSGSGCLTYDSGRFYCRAMDFHLTSLAPKCFKDVESFSVSGDFVSFLQRTTADTIQLEFGDVIKVKVKRSNTKFATKDDKGDLLFSRTVFEFPKKWTDIPDPSAFFTSFEKLGKMSAKTMSGRYPALSAVHVHRNKMEASDIKQYLSMELDEPVTEEDLLIPATAFGFIKSINPDKYQVEDNQIFFKSDTGLIGSCPLLGGDFPDMGNMLTAKGHTVKVSKFIHEAVARCAVFTSRFRFDEEKTFTIKFVSDHVVISAISAYGSTEVPVKARYPEEMEGRVIRVNPDLFEECLSHSLEILVAESSIRVQTDTSCYVAVLKSEVKHHE